MGSCESGPPLTEAEAKLNKQYIESIKAILHEEDYIDIKKEEKTFSYTNKHVILIQKTYRRYISRKHFRERVCEKFKEKNQIISAAINFKETWDIHFQKRNEYDFSLKGLNELLAKIKEVYKQFFDLDAIISSSYRITQDKIMKATYESIVNKDFRKVLMIYMQPSFSLGKIIEKEIIGFEITIEEYENNEKDFDLEDARTKDMDYADENNDALSSFKLEDTSDPLRRKMMYSKITNSEKSKKSNNDNVINLISIGGEKDSYLNVRKRVQKKFTVIQNFNKSDFQELIRKSQLMKFKDKNPSPRKGINDDNRTRRTSDNRLLDCSRFAPLDKKRTFKRLSQTTEAIKLKVVLFSNNRGANNTNEMYIDEFITSLKPIQEKECIYTSFQDPVTKVIFSGSIHQITKMKEGLGVEYMLDKSKGTIYKYCGYFSNNAFNGIGMLSNAYNEAYYGEFRNGSKNGYGYYFSDTKDYFGFFKDNLFEGFGEIKVKNKYSYSGTWRKGLKHGFGFFVSNDGSTYCGEFNEGNIDGTGFYKWSDGQTYIGNWSKGQMEGLGEYKYTNGDKFVGYYKNDLKHGRGIYYFSNGIVLKGRWIKGKKEGDFIYTNEKEKKINVVIKYSNDIQFRL